VKRLSQTLEEVQAEVLPDGVLEMSV